MRGSPGPRRGGGQQKAATGVRWRLCSWICEEAFSVLGRPGSDLLFQALRLSTIGAGEFNGRVRDGIGFRLPARATRPAKDVSGIRNQESVIRNDPGTDL